MDGGVGVAGGVGEDGLWYRGGDATYDEESGETPLKRLSSVRSFSHSCDFWEYCSR